MTVNQIIAMARSQSHTNSEQVSDADALIFLNTVYHDTMAFIKQFVAEDFFLDIWAADAIADQVNGEYVYPEQDGTNAGMEKLKGLAVKSTPDALYHVPAKQVDIRSLAYDWAWYLANQPASSPIYWIADKSLFLAPNFSVDTAGESGNAQIKLYGIKQEVDLASSGAESTILVPREYHPNVLVEGMKVYIYAHIGDEAKKKEQALEYKAQKDLMAAQLSDRDISTGQAAMPDDSNLE